LSNYFTARRHSKLYWQLN